MHWNGVGLALWSLGYEIFTKWKVCTPLGENSDWLKGEANTEKEISAAPESVFILLKVGDLGIFILHLGKCAAGNKKVKVAGLEI